MGDVVPLKRKLIKEDQRPPSGLWASGTYLCQCSLCSETFFGAKRALHCADCTYGKKASDK